MMNGTELTLTYGTLKESDKKESPSKGPANEVGLTFYARSGLKILKIHIKSHLIMSFGGTTSFDNLTQYA